MTSSMKMLIMKKRISKKSNSTPFRRMIFLTWTIRSGKNVTLPILGCQTAFCRVEN